MKQIIITVIFILTLIPLYSQDTLPQEIKSQGNTFQLEWVDHLEEKAPRWALADWTFEANNCEFTPANIRFDDGKLKLSITKKKKNKKGKAKNRPYWGAEYYSKKEYQYGRYTARMKPNMRPGVICSFFLTHIEFNEDYTDQIMWSEVDIEFVGTAHKVQFTLHWKRPGEKRYSNAVTVPLDFDASKDFHDWSIEWTPEYMAFFVDNQKLHQFDDAEQMEMQEYAKSINMNYWVSTSGEWAGEFKKRVLPLETEYEYIAYYSLKK